MTEQTNAVQADAADYRDEDGFLCCGKCHTRKEVESITIVAGANGSLMKAPCIRTKRCQCEETEYQKMEAYYKEQERRRNIESLKRICFTDQALAECTLDKCVQLPEKILSICHQYIDNWEENKRENIGLLFWGGVGNGKTSAAAAIANALLDREVSVMMRTFTDFMNATFEEKEYLFQKVSGVSLLILDDFGMERSTEYGIETVAHVINERYKSNKPAIITTNLPLDALKEQTDVGHKRIYDRVGEMCVPVFFEGESFRGNKGKEKKTKFIEQGKRYQQQKKEEF